MSVTAKRSAAARTIQAAVRRAINKNIETKTSNYSSSDGVEIFHNNFINLDSQLLVTTQGPGDPTTSTSNNRIGDKINLRGVSLKGMVELNERFSDATIRILVVKSAKGDTPTRATLFNGLSGNKMIDTINTERYTILATRTLKLKAPNFGTLGLSGAIPADGMYSATDSQVRISRSTRIWRLWIPGSKIVKGGVLTYENESAQTKFFDYNVVMYAYSNYTTSQDIYYVARSNDYVKQMYFKDA